ncbi:MAG TPA: antibiotic biosynthesis monooxygenase [Terriglobales bacterium]|nr:antibiotic biosynthesis monooxygenase [Terriglobales bacterium]
MYTRIVECHVKPGRKQEATTKMNNEVLPILQKQPGFVDMIGLTDEHDPERLLALSFWTTKEDAERYHREQFSHISDLLKPLLTTTPKVETYNVESSTTHRIAAGKAA